MLAVQHAPTAKHNTFTEKKQTFFSSHSMCLVKAILGYGTWALKRRRKKGVCLFCREFNLVNWTKTIKEMYIYFTHLAVMSKSYICKWVCMERTYLLACVQLFLFRIVIYYGWHVYNTLHRCQIINFLNLSFFFSASTESKRFVVVYYVLITRNFEATSFIHTY